MSDEDRGVGGRAVPSSRHSVDCDGVVGVRLQPGDDRSGLSAWDCELLGRFTPYIGKKEGRAKVTFRICTRKKKYKEKGAQTCSIGDPVVLDCDRGGVPANGDGGWGGSHDHQVSGSIRD